MLIFLRIGKLLIQRKVIIVQQRSALSRAVQLEMLSPRPQQKDTQRSRLVVVDHIEARLLTLLIGQGSVVQRDQERTQFRIGFLAERQENRVQERLSRLIERVASAVRIDAGNVRSDAEFGD